MKDILADEQLFENLLCLIIVGAVAAAIVFGSFKRND